MEEEKKQWKKLNRDCLGKTFRGDFSEAIQDGLDAEKLAENLFGDPSPELADSQKNLAMANFYSAMASPNVGNPKNLIMDFSTLSLQTAEKIIDQDPDIASEVIHQHAVVLHGFKDYAKAEKYYTKALELRKSKDISKNIIAKSLGDMARLYADMDQKEKSDAALLDSKKTLKDFIEEQKDKSSGEYLEATYDYAIITSNIGYVNELKKDYPVALENYSESVSALETMISLGGHPQEQFINNVGMNMGALKNMWPEGAAQLEELMHRLTKVLFPS